MEFTFYINMADVISYIEFIKWGIISNIIFSVFVPIMYAYKIPTLSKDEFKELNRFFAIRSKTIKDANSSVKVIMSRFLILLPFYSAYLAIIQMYHLMAKPGLYGMIDAMIKWDNFSIVRLIEYEFIVKNK